MKYLITIIISLFAINSNADTLTVKQDGTGDYTTIQGAVNAALNGDTVLVWPGTYYENVDFIGKNITLASLMLTTGDESYKYNTIIDGNQTGSCVKVMSGETGAMLFGLTLQHGSGTNFGHPVLHMGGGIIITYSACSIFNCIISDNTVDGSGGGIYSCFYSHLYISNTSIFSNHAHKDGGGIIHGYESTIQFDPVNRCSVYLNYASRGCDFIQGDNGPLTINLDTCTVLNPDNYYIISVDQYGYPLTDLTFNIQNHIITPKDADLYVDPQTGDNNNSGLMPSDPLQTIAFAYSSIVVDSIDKNTIHLANGIYSDSANSEKFPLNIKPYINIIGESRNGIILDGMYKSLMLKGNNEVSNYSFSKMTMERGGYIYYNNAPLHTPAGFAFLYAQNDNIVFDSILFKNGHGYSYMGNYNVQSSNNVMIKNCEFVDNLGAYAIRTGADFGDTITISNCIFDNNIPDYQQEYVRGGALTIYAAYTPTIIQNCLFINNNKDNVQSASLLNPSHTYFVNCTFAQNTHISNIRPLGSIDANLYLYNCILYDNGGETSVSFGWNETTDTISLEVFNSLIEGGEESIYIEPGPTMLVYDESNIDTDPLFYGGPEFPYNLSDLSPCINAGTLDLPDFIELPEFDLAGNPRVYGETIDMGAYEWNPTVGVDEHFPIKKEREKLLGAAPNPFSGSTTITAIFKTKSNIKIEVYNNHGQRVRSLMDGPTLPGTSKIIWRGDDDSGQPLPAGVYYLVMFADGNVAVGKPMVTKEVETVKVVKR